MSDGFIVVDRPAADLDDPRRRLDGTGPSTSGTGLMIAEEFQLGLEDFLKGPLDHGLADFDGERLEGVEVAVEPGAVGAEGAAGDDFSPPVGHVTEIGQIVGLSFGERHDESILELGERDKLGKSA
jgi:hypothetical protein